jgi:hypothetical protein
MNMPFDLLLGRRTFDRLNKRAEDACDERTRCRERERSHRWTQKLRLSATVMDSFAGAKPARLSNSRNRGCPRMGS